MDFYKEDNMDFYKKVIKNQETRFKILDFLKLIPDRVMLKIQYKIKLGRKLDLNNPKRFSEKTQWYKLNYRDPLMTKCADKYLVREYITEKGFSEILVDLYGVYKNPEHINIDQLPEKFIIKTTNGSGTNYICKSKKDFDIKQVRNQLSKWMTRNIYSASREWAYKNITPRIIVEELIEDFSNEFDGINDYKIFCFNGKVEYIVVDVDRSVGHKRNIYTKDWDLINTSTDYPQINKEIIKPEGLDKMIEIAEILSEEFPHVRVDLYWVNNRIYFGELTFYPWTGYIYFSKDEFDYELGDKFVLPPIKKEEVQ